MAKAKGSAKGTRKGTQKTKPRSPAKGRRERNSGTDRPLSFVPGSEDDMRDQAVASSNRLVHDSINRVVAECDKVDAALIEMTRQETRQDMPSLAIKELDAADSGSAVQRGWAVVSADPHKPLTEWQAREIVAAMRSPPTNARN